MQYSCDDHTVMHLKLCFPFFKSQPYPAAENDYKVDGIGRVQWEATMRWDGDNPEGGPCRRRLASPFVQSTFPKDGYRVVTEGPDGPICCTTDSPAELRPVTTRLNEVSLTACHLLLCVFRQSS